MSSESPQSRASEESTTDVLTQITREDLSKSLLDIVIESWRFARLSSRVLDQLGSDEQSRYRSQYSWFEKKLQQSLGEIDLKIVSVEGHPLDSGLPVTALNLEDFTPDETLVVDQMIEPIIKSSTGIVRTGVVTVRREQP